MGSCHSKLAVDAGRPRNMNAEAKEILSQIDAIARLVPDLHSLTGLSPNITRLDLKPSLSNNPNMLRYISAYITNAIAAIEFMTKILHGYEATCKASASLGEAAMFLSKKDYKLCLSRMADFDAVGDPFKSLLVEDHSSVVERHKTAEATMSVRRKKLKNKLSFVKRSRKVWKVACEVALVLSAVTAVVLTLLGLPLVATAAPVAGTALIKAAEQWLDATLMGHEEEVAQEMEVIRPLLAGSMMGHNLDTIRILVERVENQLGLLADDVDFVIREEDEMAAMVAINGIRDRLTELDNVNNRLERKVVTCINEIKDGVTEFIKLIIDS